MKLNKIDRFWNWFLLAGQAFRRSSPNAAKIICFEDEIEEQLLICCGKGVTVELSLISGDQLICTLVFTARGDEGYFYKIRQLLQWAPVMKGWDFVEFVPPVKIDYNILRDFEGVEIDPFDCWFDSAMVIDFRNRFMVSVYIKTPGGITTQLESALITIIFNILGEVAYGEKLGGVYIGNLLTLDEEEKNTLVNLQELPDYFEIPYAYGLTISGNGKLIATKAIYKRK